MVSAPAALPAAQLERELNEVAWLAGARLKQAGWMVATAESCTGGAIARALTEIGGSSAWFERGFVTYSNESKMELLCVNAATLAGFGAVSEEVAREMATGALRFSRAQMALSVTGVAGPGGGSADKPVGTVCFGWAIDGRVESRRLLIPGDRTQVRLATAIHALRQLMNFVPESDSQASLLA